MIAAPRIALCGLLLLCACRGPEQPPPSTTPRPGAAVAMARDQLFFVSEDDEPLLFALIVQRNRRGDGGVLEAKAFAARGRWLSPSWERVELPRWPGASLDASLDAWQRARGGAPLKLRWREDGGSAQIELRAPGRALKMEIDGLRSAGSGQDPHGPVSWRIGRAQVEVDGAPFAGLALLERLDEAARSEPRFHRFEMWLLAPARGGLVLGRRWLGPTARGEALRVSSLGEATRGPFELLVEAGRDDAVTGFALPTRWRLPTDDGLILSREGGEIGRGRAPGGGPALYDISYARSEPEGAGALVFHLED